QAGGISRLARPPGLLGLEWRLVLWYDTQGPGNVEGRAPGRGCVRRPRPGRFASRVELRAETVGDAVFERERIAERMRVRVVRAQHIAPDQAVRARDLGGAELSGRGCSRAGRPPCGWFPSTCPRAAPRSAARNIRRARVLTTPESRPPPFISSRGADHVQSVRLARCVVPARRLRRR